MQYEIWIYMYYTCTYSAVKEGENIKHIQIYKNSTKGTHKFNNEILQDTNKILETHKMQKKKIYINQCYVHVIPNMRKAVSTHR